jgi:hypothetical protein
VAQPMVESAAYRCASTLWASGGTWILSTLPKSLSLYSKWKATCFPPTIFLSFASVPPLVPVKISIFKVTGSCVAGSTSIS